jgi:hypothetical protein
MVATRHPQRQRGGTVAQSPVLHRNEECRRSTCATVSGIEPHRDELAFVSARLAHPGRDSDWSVVLESEKRGRVTAPTAPVGLVVLALFGKCRPEGTW